MPRYPWPLKHKHFRIYLATRQFPNYLDVSSFCFIMLANHEGEPGKGSFK